MRVMRQKCGVECALKIRYFSSRIETLIATAIWLGDTAAIVLVWCWVAAVCAVTHAVRPGGCISLQDVLRMKRKGTMVLTESK